MPISRARSNPFTSITFIMPMPPTSNDKHAIDASNMASEFCVSLAADNCGAPTGTTFKDANGNTICNQFFDRQYGINNRVWYENIGAFGPASYGGGGGGIPPGGGSGNAELCDTCHN